MLTAHAISIARHIRRTVPILLRGTVIGGEEENVCHPQRAYFINPPFFHAPAETTEVLSIHCQQGRAASTVFVSSSAAEQY